MKKIFSALLLIFLAAILTPQHLYAQENKANLLGEKSLTEGYTISRNSTNMIINRVTSDLLQLTSASLMDLGDQRLRVYGEAYTFDIVDEIRIELRLQRWTGSSWDTIKTWKTTQYDDDSADLSIVYYGANKGDKYRVIGYYTVYDNGKKETDQRTTEYIVVK